LPRGVATTVPHCTRSPISLDIRRLPRQCAATCTPSTRSLQHMLVSTWYCRRTRRRCWMVSAAKRSASAATANGREADNQPEASAMVEHEWARGRIRRRKIKADPPAAMTLLALAAAVATHGEPGWSESIRVMYGISPGQLQTLGDVIEGEPRWRRRGVIVSAAPELTGRDLVALERV